MQKAWYLDRVEELMDLCPSCDRCIDRIKCRQEWDELSGNIDSSALLYHSVRLAVILHSAHARQLELVKV